jgi:hypothetical protein
MRKAEMQKLQGQAETHDCAPKDWRDVPNLTGDYDLDATIEHRDNPSLPSRLEMYVKRGHNSYGARTGYNGYHGYSGDD